MVCKSSETRFVMLCETLLENYYSSALNVFGSRKHDMECIRLLCYILANYSFWSEENCFLHLVWKMSDGNFSPVKEKLQDVEITPRNVTKAYDDADEDSYIA